MLFRSATCQHRPASRDWPAPSRCRTRCTRALHQPLRKALAAIQGWHQGFLTEEMATGRMEAAGLAPVVSCEAIWVGRRCTGLLPRHLRGWSDLQRGVATSPQGSGSLSEWGELWKWGRAELHEGVAPVQGGCAGVAGRCRTVETRSVRPVEQAGTVEAELESLAEGFELWKPPKQVRITGAQSAQSF